jgi:mannose-6-phosphate isomerase-like protein (cupin superfamily)
MAEDLELPGGVPVTIALDGEATGGALTLLVDRPPVGWSLPPHRHRNESETIHVVDGRFELIVEGERRELGPGDAAHVPAGTLHAGRNLGDEPGRRVIVFSPAGVEGWFRAAAADPARAGELALQYGWEFE